MQPEVRYCTTEDGVRVAYCTEGEGPPVLFMPGFVESFSGEHVPEETEALRRMTRGRRLIRFDMRGTGLSDRDPPDMSRESLLKDVSAVVLALDIDTLSVVGGAIGGLRALDYAAHYASTVDRLAVWSTVSRLSDAFSPEMLRGLATLARTDWDVCARMLVGMGVRGRIRDAQVALRLADLYMFSATGDVVARLIEENIDGDVTPMLSRITANTLVLSGTGSPFYPIGNAQKIAAAIPNARLVPLPVEFISTTDVRHIAQPINSLLTEGLSIEAPPEVEHADVSTRSLSTAMTAILFADIADSTALTERMGDTAFREKARELDAMLRAAIRENAGIPIEGKLLGDGVLAVFTSAREAIQTASCCAAAGASAGMPLHVGLHAGDVIREDNNVYGGAVNIASRIAGLSAAGEVLVSETVRSLARTSAGVRFEDRGEQALKGVGEAVRVWAVREGNR